MCLQIAVYSAKTHTMTRSGQNLSIGPLDSLVRQNIFALTQPSKWIHQNSNREWERFPVRAPDGATGALRDLEMDGILAKWCLIALPPKP